METDVHFARLLADLPEALVCDEAFLGELAKNAKLISVKKGDYLLRTGELCQDAYFINKGLFINLYVNENGNECVTGFAADNMFPFLSAIGYFTKQPSEFEIKALEAGELLCFSRDHIESLSFRYPLFASYSTAEEFIQFLYTNYAWMINRVPDKYIAHYMGISNAWYCKLKRKVLSFTRTE